MRSINVPISEFSFANLFLFRESHRYEVLRDADEIWIRGRSYDGHTYLMPTRDLQGVDPEYLTDITSTVDFIYPVPEQWLSTFSEDRLNLTFYEGDSDYLYLTERIETYAGKKLHKKRNLLNFFLKHYSHDAQPLTAEKVPDALGILDTWLKESGQDPSRTDYISAREALEKMEELVLCGGIWYAEGRPSGYILGEELTEDTFVLHFAKGLTQFKGIYQYIFSSFASVLPCFYKNLNMEQDLGREALRHSKESYVPENKIVKWRVSSK